MSNVVNLSKGSRVNVTKENPGLTKLLVGLAWDAQQRDGKPFDADVIAFLMNSEGKVAVDKDMIFFNNLEHPTGAVKHSGDNRTGEGEGDDETIAIDLSKLPASIEKIQISVILFGAEENNQNFGQLNNAAATIYNGETKTPLYKFDLTEDYSNKTALVAVELYKKDGEWRLNSVGEGYNKGIDALCREVGLSPQ